MALIKCDDCGCDVSTNAEACPTCGNPVKNIAASGEDTGSALVLCRMFTNVQEVSKGNHCERCGSDLKPRNRINRPGCFVRGGLAVIFVLFILLIMTFRSETLYESKRTSVTLNAGREMIGDWRGSAETLWLKALPMRTALKTNLLRRRFSDGSKTELKLTIKEPEIFKDSETGKMYKIKEQGDLDIYGKNGYIRTVKKIR